MRYRFTTLRPINIGNVGATTGAVASAFDTDFEPGPDVAAPNGMFIASTIEAQPLRNGRPYGPPMFVSVPEDNVAGITDLDCG